MKDKWKKTEKNTKRTGATLKAAKMSAWRGRQAPGAHQMHSNDT